MSGRRCRRCRQSPCVCEDLVETVQCPSCSVHIPAAELLKQLPGESGGEYATRLRREWRRETTRPRRRAPSEAITDDDISEVLAAYGR